MERTMQSIRINNIWFNQDYTWFSVATDSGFLVYNTFPLKRMVDRDIDGSLKSAMMLYRTNLLGLIGGGLSPKYSPTKLIIWDDRNYCVTGELTLMTKVKSFAFRRDYFAAVLEDKVMVFSLKDLELIRSYDTVTNLEGIVALNTVETESAILAIFGSKRGNAKVWFIENSEIDIEIECHQTDIKYLALNPHGTILATASVKGTLIRIFETRNGSELIEVRRGSENATIQWIAFNSNSTYLACTSDKGTAHMFSLYGSETDNLNTPDQYDSDENQHIRRESVLTVSDGTAPKNK